MRVFGGVYACVWWRVCVCLVACMRVFGGVYACVWWRVCVCLMACVCVTGYQMVVVVQVLTRGSLTTS